MVLMNSGQALVVQNKHGQNEPEHPRIAEEPVLFWPLMLRLISLQRSCSLRERDLEGNADVGEFFRGHFSRMSSGPGVDISLTKW